MRGATAWVATGETTPLPTFRRAPRRTGLVLIAGGPTKSLLFRVRSVAGKAGGAGFVSGAAGTADVEFVIPKV